MNVQEAFISETALQVICRSELWVIASYSARAEPVKGTIVRRYCRNLGLQSSDNVILLPGYLNLVRRFL